MTFTIPSTAISLGVLAAIWFSIGIKCTWGPALRVGIPLLKKAKCASERNAAITGTAIAMLFFPFVWPVFTISSMERETRSNTEEIHGYWKLRLGGFSTRKGDE